MEKQAKTIQRCLLQFALLLSAATAGYAAAQMMPAAQSAGVDTVRMAACIRKLAEYENSLTSDRLEQRGEVEYLYNPEQDLSLYRTNYVSESDGKQRFEKHLVEVFSNATLARYAEEDGQPLTEDVTVFNAEYDRLFQNAP